MSRYYILNESGYPASEDDPVKWAQWFEKADRIIAKDTFNEVVVSTVFLGIDHRMGSSETEDRPILYETMIFNGKHKDYQERYDSNGAALQGHMRACALAREEYHEKTCAP